MVIGLRSRRLNPVSSAEKLSDAVAKVTGGSHTVNKAAKESGIDRRLIKRLEIPVFPMWPSGLLTEFSSRRKLSEIDSGPSPTPKRGRRRLISLAVIETARKQAEERDLSKGSATSAQEVLDSVDRHRRAEMEQKNLNSHAVLQAMSSSTRKRVLKDIVPMRIRSGGSQSKSRQKALLDPRNAISCAATWSAVTEGVIDPRQIHSWDELSVELNGFGNKIPIWASDLGVKRMRKINLNPSATLNQGKRRTIKFGISKCLI